METVFRHLNEGITDVNTRIRTNEVSESTEGPQNEPGSDTVSTIYVQNNDQTGGNNDMEFVWSFDGSFLTPADANNSHVPLSKADETRLPTPITSRDDKGQKSRDLLNEILSGQPGSPPVEQNAAVWIRTQVKFPNRFLVRSLSNTIDSIILICLGR
jgi:hypothetical protein